MDCCKKQSVYFLRAVLRLDRRADVLLVDRRAALLAAIGFHLSFFVNRLLFYVYCGLKYVSLCLFDLHCRRVLPFFALRCQK